MPGDVSPGRVITDLGECTRSSIKKLHGEPVILIEAHAVRFLREGLPGTRCRSHGVAAIDDLPQPTDQDPEARYLRIPPSGPRVLNRVLSLVEQCSDTFWRADDLSQC